VRRGRKYHLSDDGDDEREIEAIAEERRGERLSRNTSSKG